MKKLKYYIELISMLFGPGPNEFEEIDIYPSDYCKKAFFWCGRWIFPEDKDITKTITFKRFYKEDNLLEYSKIYTSWLVFYLEWLVDYLKGKPWKNGKYMAAFTTKELIYAYSKFTGKLEDRKNCWEENKYNWKKYINSLNTEKPSEENNDPVEEDEKEDGLSDEEALDFLENYKKV